MRTRDLILGAAAAMLWAAAAAAGQPMAGAAQGAGPGATAPAAAAPADWRALLERLQNGAAARPAACCRTCRKGKACGDSCISRARTCRVGPGCACDG